MGIDQPRALLPEGELILGGDPREDREAAGVDSHLDSPQGRVGGEEEQKAQESCEGWRGH